MKKEIKEKVMKIMDLALEINSKEKKHNFC